VKAVDAAGNRSETITRRVAIVSPRIDGLDSEEESELGYSRYTLRRDRTVELVLVPGGVFLRGALPGDEEAEMDERIAHRVRVGAFVISRREITWEQYLRFCEDSGHTPPEGAREAPLDHPVTKVTWQDAQAYCTWAGLRLPTESEWERAARLAPDDRIWPWGSEWRAEAANATGQRGNTTSVGSYPATGDLGLFDVAGNAAEWCADWYAADAYAVMPEPDPTGPNVGTLRVVRGGAWRSPAAGVRISARRGVAPDTRSPDLGFRLAGSVPGR
jgi:formylglycine-generating enzyme required for sulfatase activity